MEFTVTLAGVTYLKEEVDILTSLGFNFRPRNERYLRLEDSVDITINTLEELMEFIEKYGALVIDQNSIEIYEFRRE